MIEPGRLSAARTYVFAQARLLEQRLFAALFEGGPGESVLAALRAYRNGDGGFGHGLEPDKRCPESQPLDVLVAVETMQLVGSFDVEALSGACSFLETVADERGAVPPVLPSIAGYPRAAHWGDGVLPAGLSPTAGIVAGMRKAGLRHPWLERAERFCREELERHPPDDAHVVREALAFLEDETDREGAAALAADLVRRLPETAFFRADPADRDYGLTPLELVPTPEARWRPLFDDGDLERQLDALEREQQPDGGWPISWEPPTEASRLEWRGRRTVDAVRTLIAYGRVARREG